MGAKSQIKLEKEDHQRDADFGKVLHGESVDATGGFAAMLKKNKQGKQVAVDEYFKHFDNKTAEAETDADREVVPTAKSCSLRKLTRRPIRPALTSTRP